MSTVVSMDDSGQPALPLETRQALGISGETQFEVEVEDSAVVLRPAVALPEDDRWAFTDEHRVRLEEALREAREGRAQRLTRSELQRLITQASE